MHVTSIAPLLRALSSPSYRDVPIDDIVAAVALSLHNRLSPVQCAGLLSILASNGRDREPAIIAKCAARMREAGLQVDIGSVQRIIKSRSTQRATGSYHGGLCEIAGTGGDGHGTFNISTASSLLASVLMPVSKHGAGASSSKSGAADVLRSIEPKGPTLEGITPKTIPKVYMDGTYAFLFAPYFHPGLKQLISLRRDLGIKSIFNLIGPLAHPLEGIIEARIVGVSEPSLGPIYAEALGLSGVRKAMVVCGAECLDEISCAGPTYCWRLSSNKDETNNSHVTIQAFELKPSDFGLSPHPLSHCLSNKEAVENARFLTRMLSNQLPRDDPTLQFVLINTAALLVVSGMCEAKSSSMGPGDTGQVDTSVGPGGGHWREGIRRARWIVESGLAIKSLHKYIAFTNQ